MVSPTAKMFGMVDPTGLKSIDSPDSLIKIASSTSASPASNNDQTSLAGEEEEYGSFLVESPDSLMRMTGEEPPSKLSPDTGELLPNFFDHPLNNSSSEQQSRLLDSAVVKQVPIPFSQRSSDDKTTTTTSSGESCEEEKWGAVEDVRVSGSAVSRSLPTNTFVMSGSASADQLPFDQLLLQFHQSQQPPSSANNKTAVSPSSNNVNDGFEDDFDCRSSTLTRRRANNINDSNRPKAPPPMNMMNNFCDKCAAAASSSSSSYSPAQLRRGVFNSKRSLSNDSRYYQSYGTPMKGNPKSNKMTIGRKKFNMDPKKGIEYLVEQGLIQNTPEDVAEFLHKGEGLNKSAVGDYLGEKADFNLQVLQKFVELHDFKDLILVQALRQFLWSFRLPGEAQKIDRMMETFAQRYCALNPNLFSSPDTCYVLSFAVIMLNTSLHNPSVKDKPSVEQFLKMNRGIDEGNDLPEQLLRSLYESIRTEEFKIPEDDGNDLMHTFFNPDREGWLLKQGAANLGGRYRSWKRRWFILNDKCLYYFEFTADKEPRGIIPLENVQIREVNDKTRPHCFEIYSITDQMIKACKTDSDGKVIEGRHTVYRMAASNEEEKEQWIQAIQSSISLNPFHEVLQARKKKVLKNNK